MGKYSLDNTRFPGGLDTIACHVSQEHVQHVGRLMSSHFGLHLLREKSCFHIVLHLQKARPEVEKLAAQLREEQGVSLHLLRHVKSQHCVGHGNVIPSQVDCHKQLYHGSCRGSLLLNASTADMSYPCLLCCRTTNPTPCQNTSGN